MEELLREITLTTGQPLSSSSGETSLYSPPRGDDGQEQAESSFRDKNIFGGHFTGSLETMRKIWASAEKNLKTDTRPRTAACLSNVRYSVDLNR